MPSGWKLNNVRGKGKRPPGIAGQFHGNLTLIASARCMWDDLRDLGDIGGDTMSVNLAGSFFRRPVDHWASLHPRFLVEHCVPLKRLFQHQPAETHIYTHSIRYAPGIDVIWDILQGNSGTSGMFAILVALALGYDRIVVCGLPLDDSGHFYDNPYKPTIPMDRFGETRVAQLWGHNVNLIQKTNKVRAMSGMTARWFGKPDKEWLHGNN